MENCVQFRLFSKNIAVPIILLAVLIFSPFPAFAQDVPSGDTTPPESPSFDTASTLNYEDVWLQFMSAIKANNKEKAKKVLESLHTIQYRKGDNNIPTYSYALLQISKDLENNGDTTNAEYIILKAIEFSPDKPIVYFAMANHLWHNSPTKIFTIINYYAQGIGHSLADTAIFTTLIANLLLMVLITLLVSFTLFSLILAVKYIPLAANDLKVFFDWDIPVWFFILFNLFLLVVFASLDLGVIWLIIFLNIALFVYYSKTERYIAAAFYILLVFSPVLVNNTATMMLSSHQQSVDEMISVIEDPYSERVEKELVVWSITNPDDIDVIFTLGLLNKKLGHLSDAEKYYLEVISLDGNHYQALNNLGNIYFILRNYDMAEKYYLRALDIHPDSAEVNFNLYTLNLMKDDFDIYKAEEYRVRADELAPQRISDFTDKEPVGSKETYTYMDRVNRIVMDHYISESILLGRILSSPDAKKLSSSIWSDLMKGISFRLTSGLSILILALSFLIATFKTRYVFSKACKYCGEPFLLKSLTHMDKRDSCNRCFSVFIRREGVDPKTKADLRMKVERKNSIVKIILRIVNLVLPGFGTIYRGDTIKGFIFMLLYLFTVVNILYLDGIVVYPTHATGFPFIHNFFIFFVLLIIVYIISQRDFFISERST